MSSVLFFKGLEMYNVSGEQGVLIGFLNSFVHVIMYSYYLLAALGPQVQKYLWWKKYITKLQLVNIKYTCLTVCEFSFHGTIKS